MTIEQVGTKDWFHDEMINKQLNINHPHLLYKDGDVCIMSMFVIASDMLFILNSKGCSTKTIFVCICIIICI